MRDAIAHIGGPVHLVGDCQGGWLAAIVAALDPASVASLTVGAAPIDFHAGDGPLLDHVALSAGKGGAPYRALVEAGGGVLRGEVMVAGFIALAPEDEIRKQLDLLLSLRDPDYVARYNDFEDWFKYTQDIAGALLPLDHGAPVRGQRAGRRHAAGRRPHGRSRPDHVPGARSSPARATTSRRPTRRSRWPTTSARRPTRSAATWSTPATSACSWAAPRCATTGRRCSRRSPDAPSPGDRALTTLAATRKGLRG